MPSGKGTTPEAMVERLIEKLLEETAFQLSRGLAAEQALRGFASVPWEALSQNDRDRLIEMARSRHFAFLADLKAGG